ncbi:hypothetical protein B0T18DRAFT_396036 [Schizothecium vesticola]|uniref:Uncharacterized protein n=1 Tax=Schizothecium vesticola TaxID=314040 RepID=A0AA40F8F0_9PEZI|nr:hypothetical protein B0T18DRAFT_396036 [Schizothecium vesticola]
MNSTATTTSEHDIQLSVDPLSVRNTNVRQPANHNAYPPFLMPPQVCPAQPRPLATLSYVFLPVQLEHASVAASPDGLATTTTLGSFLSIPSKTHSRQKIRNEPLQRSKQPNLQQPLPLRNGMCSPTRSGFVGLSRPPPQSGLAAGMPPASALPASTTNAGKGGCSGGDVFVDRPLPGRVPPPVCSGLTEAWPGELDARYRYCILKQYRCKLPKRVFIHCLAVKLTAAGSQP